MEQRSKYGGKPQQAGIAKRAKQQLKRARVGSKTVNNKRKEWHSQKVKEVLNHGLNRSGEQRVVNPVAKLENAIFQRLQSRLYHPKSTQRQLELRGKAQKQVNNSSSSQRVSQRKHERTGK
jgi:hypothetical protein